MRLLLASASPRRADLLRAAGFDVEIAPSEVDERRRQGERPEDYVRRLARAKAAAVASLAGSLPIVAADTVVVVGDRVLEKPADDIEAAAMLRLLGGRTHDVLTGVVVRFGGLERERVARTQVRMAVLSEREIAWYVRSGEPRDKAGAYGVQGLASRFVDAVDGSYSNVVGLPVAVVYALLKEVGAVESG